MKFQKLINFLKLLIVIQILHSFVHDLTFDSEGVEFCYNLSD